MTQIVKLASVVGSSADVLVASGGGTLVPSFSGKFDIDNVDNVKKNITKSGVILNVTYPSTLTPTDAIHSYTKTGTHSDKFDVEWEGDRLVITTNYNAQDLGSDVNINAGTVTYKITHGGITRTKSFDVYIESDPEFVITRDIIQEGGTVTSTQFRHSNGTWGTLNANDTLMRRTDYDFRGYFSATSSKPFICNMTLKGCVYPNVWETIASISTNRTTSGYEYINNIDIDHLFVDYPHGFNIEYEIINISFQV